MAGAVALGISGALFVLCGFGWVRHRRRIRARTLRGWGAVSAGLCQLLHAVGMVSGEHPAPLFVVGAVVTGLGSLALFSPEHRRRLSAL